jgi:hypothetical protein
VEQISNEIRVGFADPRINALLESIGSEERPFQRHFNQSEDFFLHLDGTFSVPHFQIHHDVRLREPSPDYAANLTTVAAQLTRLAPQLLKDLTYVFDPAEILRPCFYRVYPEGGNLYLYLLRVDLMMRATEATVQERGTNDMTPAYLTRRIFVEPTIIPLGEVVHVDEKVTAFRIRQTISQTWIGEFGRGYFQQGIWMDADLTKFFTRLFLPSGKKTYPYYPYLCKYKTVCQSIIGLSPAQRAASVPLLHRSLGFLLPEMERIQADMESSAFSEQMPVFLELKQAMPADWYEAWNNVRVQSYLNEADMKEYRIDD